MKSFLSVYDEAGVVVTEQGIRTIRINTESHHSFIDNATLLQLLNEVGALLVLRHVVREAEDAVKVCAKATCSGESNELEMLGTTAA